MRKVVSVLAGGIIAAGALFAGSHGSAHWGYSGHEGPEHWGDLSPDYRICKDGKNQSPVDLTGFIEAELPPLKLEYEAVATTVVNNGHTVKVNFGEGSELKVDGKEFELKQYHFHTPSENTIEGKYYPMEAHFVHASDKGELAVISVMIKEGKANPSLQAIVDNMPAHTGDKNSLKKYKLNAADLLPANKDYYRFNGSLTTPPCSEGVRWLVMKEPVEASKEQLKAFEKVMGKNNRPLQPINARVILK
ncbi:carbonic anhydrase [Nitrosophilus alvini]|uniref:carbonic anhydrase n=1 Tax=Nitrosophilus alvini TaxID=2714855 RepID=UPI001909DC44|nr:carbonic anhydrase family protein [Nitrosophilus alvini]